MDASTEEFIPPSENIQKLFAFEKSSVFRGSPCSTNTVDDYVFTEEDYAKMPSTLMKAVKRTNILLIQTEVARKAAIETNNELKSIHSLMVRYARKMLKDAEKSEAQTESNIEKGKLRGFRRQCKISDAMCEFMGLEPNTTASRVEVNHAIYEYIKTNGLIDKEYAQLIVPDEKLWGILSEDAKGNKITYFSIQKYIKHHF
jgi:chromatin remodeling complex protein RSC6